MNWAMFRSLRFQLAAALAVILTLIWAGVAFQLKTERDDALNSARRHGENITGVVAEHFVLFTESVDSWMQHLGDQWAKDPRRFAQIGARQRGLLKQEHLLRISVIDAQGWLAYSDPSNAQERVFLGDREPFKVHKDSGANRLYIGKPVTERASNKTAIEFARSIRDERGKFLGVLVLSISAEALIRTYPGIDLGAQGFIALRYADGTVLVRPRNYEQVRQRSMPDWREVVKDDSTAGSFIRSSAGDGLERIFSFRRLTGTPFIVVVGQSVEGVLARYYDERRAYVAGGALICVVLTSLVLIVFAKLDREKRAEGKLRESEARYRALSDLSADSYWEQDEQYRFTMILPGQSFKPVVQHQSMLGKTRWELPHVAMTDEDWRTHREVLDRHKTFRDLLLKVLDAEGRLVYISVSGHPFFDNSGAFKGYRGIAKEITREKRGEQLLALEHTAARRLSEASNASAGLKAVIQAVCESQSWECGRYFSADEEAGLLRFADFWSGPGEQLERFISASRAVTFAPGVSLAGRAWQSGEPLWSRDFTKDPRAPLRSVSRATGIRGVFVFPVLSEGKVIGVFTFNSREVREPDERLLQAAGVIGSQVGQFLRRKHAEQVLRNSEERFRSLTNLSSDVYWEQDEQYRFTAFSHSGPEWIHAHGPDSLGKARWEQNYLNMMPADWEAHIALLDARRPFHDLELCRLAERGGTVWISVSGEPMFDESGTFKGYRGVGKDITARKRAETVLRLEHTVTRCLAEADDASPAMQEIIRAVCETWNWECGRYFRVDEAAGVLRFADAWSVPDAEVERYIELWRDVSYVPGVGLAGRAWQSGEPQWAADLTSDPRISRRAIACEAGMRGAFVFPITAEGNVLGVFAFNSREVREPDERLLTATKVIGSQIGQFLQRKHAEEALRKGNERFNLAVRATNDVIWDWDLVTDALWWNENITTVFGYRREDIEPTGKSWRERIHPEDRERVVTGMHERVESGGESWSDEYRFQRKDNGYACVFDRGHVIRDRTGKAVRMIGAMADITVRKEAEERLAYLAQFDSLTGLPNRHLFRDRLVHTMAQARRSGKSMAVLFIDLDRFKLVNDTLGHGAGDRLLKEATERLQACVRRADTVGRFGGDEFGAILSELAKPGDASVVAQKIIDALARPFNLDGHETYVTASIGITLFPADSEEASTLIMNADVAMYRAKEQGRNTYQYFTREMNERAQKRMQLETVLRRAVEHREFLLHYQPKLEVAGGALCGFEALLRWQHPERGLVSPVEFIPVLEETGLIVPVGEWVMREVCAQIKGWRKAGFSVPPIAVNLSARQFQQKDLEITVRRILRDTGVDPSLIQFELTESLLMKDPEAAARTLGGLKELGVKISVDDFGTGYSSLAYLKRFPIDALKIDRAFIRDITVDPDDAAITLAIIGLAHSLKLKVIAEGVETESQLEFLAAHACDEVQGYFFSKAVAPEACERMLREGSARGIFTEREDGAASQVLSFPPRPRAGRDA